MPLPNYSNNVIETKLTDLRANFEVIMGLVEAAHKTADEIKQLKSGPSVDKLQLALKESYLTAIESQIKSYRIMFNTDLTGIIGRD